MDALHSGMLALALLLAGVLVVQVHRRWRARPRMVRPIGHGIEVSGIHEELARLRAQQTRGGRSPLQDPGKKSRQLAAARHSVVQLGWFKTRTVPAGAGSPADPEPHPL